MASKLLHHLIRDRLGEICHLLENPSSAPPICLAKNGSPYQAEAKKGGAQEPEDPDAVSDASVRFYMEKVVSLESLVMGVIETAFKQMVSRQWGGKSKPHLAYLSCGKHFCPSVSLNTNITEDFSFNNQKCMIWHADHAQRANHFVLMFCFGFLAMLTLL